MIAESGTLVDAPVEIPKEEPGGWEFRASLYGWMTGLEGTTGVGGLVADVDVEFVSIIDDIDMVAALQFEARKGPWGILADGFYVDLGASGPSPGPLYEQVGVEMKQFMGELSVAYRVYETPCVFVYVYGGMRYNRLDMGFEGTLDLPGIQAASANAGARIVEGIGNRAAGIVQEKIEAFKEAGAARRAAIEGRIAAAIEGEADGRIKRDLVKQLLEIRRDGGLDIRDIVSNRISRALKERRLELARSTAQLEVAKLRDSVGEAAQDEVATARARVDKAEDRLAAAINHQLAERLPVQKSADQDWLDPIVGMRAQWNITDRFFLAGKSDIGGFGVGSDLAWTLQATAGYQFTEKVSAELGYRYLHTDYSDGGFKYDIAQAGIYTSLNIRF